MSQPSETDIPPTNPGDEATGLPLLPSWPRVYWFVLIVFIIYVVLLKALSQVFA